MRSGQHLKLPKTEQQSFEENLRIQADMEGLHIEIKFADNGDNTVDVSWVVAEKTAPAPAAPGPAATRTPQPSTARAAAPAPVTPPPPASRAPASAQSSASPPTAATPGAPVSPSTTAGAPATPPTSGSQPAPSAAGPSVFHPVAEPATENRTTASVPSGTAAAPRPKVPDQAVALVIEFEGFVDHVYDDGVGVATIGYGTTRYPDRRPVRFGDPSITRETARTFLSHDLEATVDQLASSIPHWNEMDDNRRSALISFAYNLGDNFFGAGGFTTISSTLREKRWDDVPKAMELYCNPNDPKVHQGLLRRRKAEGELWQGKGQLAK